ncbi:hypothetical protein GE09DRAFT_1050356 [Coniochaeta sp. 2T2.1]|nr:hypothetical protein GE09DRAFT_1050356 [Coniochaeta sp. 2T2.1]
MFLRQHVDRCLPWFYEIVQLCSYQLPSPSPLLIFALIPFTVHLSTVELIALHLIALLLFAFLPIFLIIFHAVFIVVALRRIFIPFFAHGISPARMQRKHRGVPVRMHWGTGEFA